MANGWAIDSDGVLKELLGEQADRCKHAHAAVLDLCVTPLLQSSSVFSVGESDWVKEASRS